MAIVVGIDEAGYGPLLGPLVVSATAFEVPDDAAQTCLWEMLSASVTRAARRHDVRLPVVDSKKLYQRDKGIGTLERTALAMLQSAKPAAGTFRELLDRVAPQCARQLDKYPWYAGFDPPLPVETDAGIIATQANAVRRDARQHGIRLAAVMCEPLLEGGFNRMVQATRNKSVVLMSLTLRLISRIARRADGAPVRVLVDRQGGRTHYARALMESFDGFELQIREESEQRSAYGLTCPPRALTVEFRTGGEQHHLAVALASIYSKYLRELFMRAFNRYWCDRVESLRPTAGYYTDAQRFLGDIAGALSKDAVDRSMLVRQR